MKKLVPLLAIIIAAAGAYLFITGGKATSSNTQETKTESQNGSNDAEISPSSTSSSTSSTGQKTSSSTTSTNAQDDDGDEQEEQLRPAAEAYTSSEDALAAVLKGSKDYDDSTLEQFTTPDPNCAWCPEFYTSVRELATNPNTPQEQRSYLAEILAISGRLENVQMLAEYIKNAPSNDVAEVYAEALELSMGKDDVTKFLGDQMAATNDVLREASVAAVTNQGTQSAAELLISDLKAKGDVHGYYALGMGLGEFIPDEEAIPTVQEFVRARGPDADQGVKALLNAGLPGVRVVFDELEHSPNPDADIALIKGGLDHINMEDGLVGLASEVVSRNQSPTAVKFAREIIQASQESEEGTEVDAGGEQYQSLAE